MTTFKFPAVLSEHATLGATVTALNEDDDNPIKQANASHPHFEEIIEGLKNGDPEVWTLFNVGEGVMAKLSKVSDRVSWNPDTGEVLFDGDPIAGPLADQLSRAIREGKTANYKALAAFWEKLESNPNQHSKEQAYRFLSKSKFQITEGGNVVGFKGVYAQADGTYLSWHASEPAGKPSAWVNGSPLPERQRVKQSIGDTVSMPRSEVVHDPDTHCARGLHVATMDYAKTYGDTLMEVEFNPAKLVSVPNDSGHKVRVHEYIVRRIAADEYGEETVLVTADHAVGGWEGDVGYKV